MGLWEDEEQIIRCSGRLTMAHLSEAEKYPILLPAKAHLTRLIIMDIHCCLKHAGVSHTLAQLRTQYWIPRGRAIIFHILNKNCALCKLFATKPYRVPQFPALPEFHVQQSRPFQFTGVDIFGPLYAKFTHTEKRKIWVLLFTCLSTCAIHLEILQSLTTVDLLFAIRKLVARRNCPELFLSDNALQFKLLATSFQSLSENISRMILISTHTYLQKILHGNLSQNFHPGWVVRTKE